MNATHYSDHSPVYNASTNYCDIASEIIAQAKASNTFRRQSTPLALRDHASYDYQHCANEIARAPHGSYVQTVASTISSLMFGDQRQVPTSLAFVFQSFKHESNVMYPFRFSLKS